MTIKPSILKPLTEAASGAKVVKVDVIHQTTHVDALKIQVSEGKALGLSNEARAVEREAGKVAREMKSIDDVDAALVKEQPGLRPMSAAFAAAVPPRPSWLERLFGSFSAAERTGLGERAFRLMAPNGKLRALTAKQFEGLVNAMAGFLREIVAMRLEGVRIEVIRTVASLHSMARGSRVLQPIDTAVLGAVELPTRLKGNKRFLRLGPDRLVGMGRINRRRVKVTWDDGVGKPVTLDLEIAGELDVTLAIEVKGRTTVGEGLEQLRALKARGEPQYAVIGGELWLINYDPSKVTHVVVAAAGEGMKPAIATAEELTKAGIRRTKVVEIPVELDDDIKAMARSYLEAVMTSGLPRLAP